MSSTTYIIEEFPETEVDNLIDMYNIPEGHEEPYREALARHIPAMYNPMEYEVVEVGKDYFKLKEA